MSLRKNGISSVVILLATTRSEAKAVEPQQATLPEPHVPRIHIPTYPVSNNVRKLFPCLHKDPLTRSAFPSHAIRIPDVSKLSQRLIGARRQTPYCVVETLNVMGPYHHF
jgi:hypothetical protein